MIMDIAEIGTKTIPLVTHPKDQIFFGTPSKESVRYHVVLNADRDYAVTDEMKNNPSLLRAHREMLGEKLSCMGFKTVYVPNITRSSGVVIAPERHCDTIRYPFGIVLKHTSLISEGTNLSKDEAFMLRTAGCAVLVASGEGMCIVAHGGRDALIDRNLMIKGHASRVPMSVIDSMARFARKNLVNPADMVFRSFFEISAESFKHSFSHRRHGTYNRAVVKFVRSHYGNNSAPFLDGTHCLSLSEIIRTQAFLAGFKDVHVGDFPLPDEPFYSTRDKDEHRRSGRNLFTLLVT
jgi:hypothetical protein